MSKVVTPARIRWSVGLLQCMGNRITRTCFNSTLRRACEKAGVEPWSPNQLRHAAATKIRQQSGLDAAQVILGHSSVQTTQVYAEKNLTAAVDIAAKIG